MSALFDSLRRGMNHNAGGAPKQTLRVLVVMLLLLAVALSGAGCGRANAHRG